MSAARPPVWRLSLRLSRYRLGLFTATAVLQIASNCLMLVLGWLLQRVFDALSGAAPAGFGAYELIAVLAAVEIVRIAVVWSGIVWSRCAEQLRGLLRLNVLHAQMQSGGPEAGPPAGSPGEAVSRFRDDVNDFLGFIDTGIYVVGKVVFGIGALAIMISIDPIVAVAAMLPLMAMVVAARVASGRIKAHRLAYRRETAAVTGLLAEVFGAVLAVKVARAGDGVLGRLAALNERRRRAGLRDHLVTELLAAFNRTTVDLSVGLVLLLAIPAMHSGDFTVGDLALFAGYASTLVALPHYGGRLIARHRQSGVAADRLTALLPDDAPDAMVTHRPLPVSEPAPPAVPRGRRDALRVLEVRGLTAVHPFSGRGVHDLDLTLRGGTFTVLTGPAGAGKTTLLRALLGLMPAQAGAVSWNGEPVDDLAESMVPPRTAYVPQVPRLFSESMRDNLLLGAAGPADLPAAVRAAVLDGDLETMPDGLDTHIGARGVRLSGGQVQRTAIARALLRRADLLVLDDVSSALDVATERLLWDRLLAGRRAALLVVTNRPATIARADQVIALDHGRMLRQAA